MSVRFVVVRAGVVVDGFAMVADFLVLGLAAKLGVFFSVRCWGPARA